MRITVFDETRGPRPAGGPAGGRAVCGGPLVRALRYAGTLLPGLAVTALAVLGAWGLNAAFPALSLSTAAVLLGIGAANSGLLPRAAVPGTSFAAKRILRVGVVLLGLQLAVGDVLRLGWESVLMVICVVGITWSSTVWIGRRLGLPVDAAILLATGSSICGASAIAGMDSVTRSRRDHVVTAVAVVTMYGTVAIFAVPLAAHALGMSADQLGRWAGASVHEIAQVVAAAAPGGGAALRPAVVIKLMRVALLAPIVAGTAVYRRRTASGRQAAAGGKRPPVVPLFVIGFLAMVTVRSLGWLPASLLDLAKTAQNLLFAAALFGLGSGVRIRDLVHTGGKAVVLGFISWAIIAAVAYVGVLLTA